MDAGGGDRWGQSGGEKQRGGGQPVGHPQCAVDELSDQSEQRQQQEPLQPHAQLPPVMSTYLVDISDSTDKPGFVKGCWASHAWAPNRTLSEAMAGMVHASTRGDCSVYSTDLNGRKESANVAASLTECRTGGRSHAR